MQAIENFEDTQQTYIDVGKEWSELQQSQQENSWWQVHDSPKQDNLVTQLTVESDDELPAYVSSKSN